MGSEEYREKTLKNVITYSEILKIKSLFVKLVIHISSYPSSTENI
jgi:hypothetical protein